MFFTEDESKMLVKLGEEGRSHDFQSLVTSLEYLRSQTERSVAYLNLCYKIPQYIVQGVLDDGGVDDQVPFMDEIVRQVSNATPTERFLLFVTFGELSESCIGPDNIADSLSAAMMAQVCYQLSWEEFRDQLARVEDMDPEDRDFLLKRRNLLITRFASLSNICAKSFEWAGLSVQQFDLDFTQKAGIESVGWRTLEEASSGKVFEVVKDLMSLRLFEPLLPRDIIHPAWQTFEYSGGSSIEFARLLFPDNEDLTNELSSLLFDWLTKHAQFDLRAYKTSRLGLLFEKEAMAASDPETSYFFLLQALDVYEEAAGPDANVPQYWSSVYSVLRLHGHFTQLHEIYPELPGENSNIFLQSAGALLESLVDNRNIVRYDSTRAVPDRRFRDELFKNLILIRNYYLESGQSTETLDVSATYLYGSIVMAENLADLGRAPFRDRPGEMASVNYEPIDEHSEGIRSLQGYPELLEAINCNLGSVFSSADAQMNDNDEFGINLYVTEVLTRHSEVRGPIR